MFALPSFHHSVSPFYCMIFFFFLFLVSSLCSSFAYWFLQSRSQIRLSAAFHEMRQLAFGQADAEDLIIRYHLSYARQLYHLIFEYRNLSASIYHVPHIHANFMFPFLKNGISFSILFTIVKDLIKVIPQKLNEYAYLSQLKSNSLLIKYGVGI